MYDNINKGDLFLIVIDMKKDPKIIQKTYA